eukprot:TRINITY_DN2812_c0_g1_i1.p1 TRINITY_DN2812_c0_g1~~TRINITY_DN2812_c0_g1_i1.p1  ORF type:complete len:176 (+),score=18.16 TRINITY_DN2812_c0_g1_i1:117-644(+)
MHLSQRNKTVIVFTVALLAFAVRSQDTKQVYNLIYTTFTDGVPCTRWTNTTSQVGCGTEQGGVMGFLHFLEDLAAINAFASTSQTEKLMVAIPSALFTEAVVSKLESIVVGIILLESPNLPQGYSPQTSAPQQANGSFPWNPTATSMLFRDYKTPIYLLNSTDSALVVEVWIYTE